jgi:hypothetical protein
MFASQRVVLWFKELLPWIADIGAKFLWARGKFFGICFVDPNEDTASKFVKVCEEALRWIQKHDSVRFRRIQREIETIVNLPSIRGAQYQRLGRVCTIDLKRIPDCDFEQNVELVVRFLLYFSAFGTLWSRGIMENSRSRSRIQRACIRHINGFARKANVPELEVPSHVVVHEDLTARQLLNFLKGAPNNHEDREQQGDEYRSKGRY